MISYSVNDTFGRNSFFTGTQLAGYPTNFTIADTDIVTTSQPTNPSSISSQNAKKLSGDAVAGAILGTLIGAAIIGILIFLIVFWIRIRRQRPGEVQMQMLAPSSQYAPFTTQHSPGPSSMTQSTRIIHVDPSVEIDVREIEFGESIGSGAFGIVYR